jgi:hypothetical protein
MYGPNYVKLSRVFAVQLFGMIIEHYAAYYAALPPVRSTPIGPTAMPSWPPFSIRLALTHALQYPLLATQTSTAVTTTCLDYLHPHT